jgi:hypothetical protein
MHRGCSAGSLSDGLEHRALGYKLQDTAQAGLDSRSRTNLSSHFDVSAGSSHSCPGLSPLEEHNEAGWVDRSSPSCWPELPGARPALDGRRWSRFAQVTTADFSHGSNGWKRLAAWKTPRGREAREGCPRFPSAWRQNGIGHEPQVPPLHQKQSRNFERLQQG